MKKVIVLTLIIVTTALTTNALGQWEGTVKCPSKAWMELAALEAKINILINIKKSPNPSSTHFCERVRVEQNLNQGPNVDCETAVRECIKKMIESFKMYAAFPCEKVRQELRRLETKIPPP